MKDVYHYRTMLIKVLKGTFYHGFSAVAFETNKSLEKFCKMGQLFHSSLYACLFCTKDDSCFNGFLRY